MKKKGQMGEMGLFLAIFIVAIVGVTLFIQVAQDVGVSTSTVSVANESLSTVVNGTAQYLTNYQSISDVVVYNETGDVIIGAGNYTVNNNVVYNGALAVEIIPDTTAAYKSAWLISGTAEPQGYMGGATRQMALLIPLMFALAIAIVMLSPVIKNKIMG